MDSRCWGANDQMVPDAPSYPWQGGSGTIWSLGDPHLESNENLWKTNEKQWFCTMPVRMWCVSSGSSLFPLPYNFLLKTKGLSKEVSKVLTQEVPGCLQGSLSKQVSKEDSSVKRSSLLRSSLTFTIKDQKEVASRKPWNLRHLFSLQILIEDNQEINPESSGSSLLVFWGYGCIVGLQHCFSSLPFPSSSSRSSLLAPSLLPSSWEVSKVLSHEVSGSLSKEVSKEDSLKKMHMSVCMSPRMYALKEHLRKY